MRARRIGVLVLGCGWAARIHSRVLRRLPGVELFYASRDVERAEAMRRRYGGRWAFGSYQAGLDHEGVTVALVATPTSTHRDLALRSLAAGKDVVVEKPAFLSVAEADEAAEAARATGRRVLVAENYVYKPLTLRLRRAVEVGDLGEVRFVLVNATKRQPAAGWRADPALSGGGALFEAGVHWIAFMTALGLEPAEVHAWRAGGRAGADRSSLVVLRYANGAVGTLAHSWEIAAPLGGVRLSKLQGTRGAVTFESNGFGAVTTGRRPSAWAPVAGDPLGYRRMHEDFLRALRTDAPAAYELERARRDLLLLEAAGRAMTAERPPAGAVAAPVGHG